MGFSKKEVDKLIAKALVMGIDRRNPDAERLEWLYEDYSQMIAMLKKESHVNAREYSNF